MKLDQLTAISPLDGRYLGQVTDLQPLFSEFGLMHHRLLIEVRWLQTLAKLPNIKEISPLDKKTDQLLNQLVKRFSEKDAHRIKSIEKTLHHDVKSVEQFIKQKIKHPALKEFVHFGCTSDDINNLAYALITQQARDQYLVPALKKIISHLKKQAHEWANIPMLARTHGQPATPTTLGKEFANFVTRLQLQPLTQLKLTGKFNGSTGNYSALTFAYPNIHWEPVCKQFVEQLGLRFQSHTTQIEPHDTLAELSHAFIRLNHILIDLSRDIWHYLSLHYFQLKAHAKQVGSSTMPHKINPIDFENAEGNLALSNALLNFFANQLPISRLQRDLTDSTILRNLGVAFAHSLLAYQSLLKGLKKLNLHRQTIKQDLESHWELLAEPLQILMRRYGIQNAYDKLKKLTRGKTLDKKKLHQFVTHLPLPIKEKQRFKKLTPLNYLGKAETLAKKV